MPEVLLGVGLAEAIAARHGGRVEPPPYRAGRDPQTQVTNAHGLRDYALRLADTVGEVLARGEFPVVLGGDCSILLGTLLAAARRGRHGVVFIDGHIDFYPPENGDRLPAARCTARICSSVFKHAQVQRIRHPRAADAGTSRSRRRSARSPRSQARAPVENR